MSDDLTNDNLINAHRRHSALLRKEKPSEIAMRALQNAVRDLLSECTDVQQSLFEKVYPEGIDALPESKIKDAIALCQRTLRKNETAAAYDCAPTDPHHGGKIWNSET